MLPTDRENRIKSRRSCRPIAGVLVLLPLLATEASLQPATLTRQVLVAAANGDVALVTNLLAKGANVNSDNGHGVTPLWYAAASRAVATSEAGAFFELLGKMEGTFTGLFLEVADTVAHEHRSTSVRRS